MRNPFLTGGCLFFAAAIALTAADANKSDDKPSTHKIKPAPFRVELKLDGVFEPVRSHPVKLAPKVWSELTVLEAAAHGQVVKKGDVLLRLDPEKFDQKVRDTEIGFELARLDLELAKGDLQFAEKTAPLDLASVERAYRNVQQDLERYLKVQQPFDIKSAQVSLKSAGDYLAYAEEELKQLKKMYKADDLTEETEEIILKRAQDSVDRARHSMAGSKISNDITVQFSIPRAEELKKEEGVRQQEVLVKSKAALARDLQKKRLGLDRQQLQFDKTKEALDELKADRAVLVIKAAAGGVVYHGSFNNGQWSGAGAASARLVKDGKLLAGDTVMTIVEPRPMWVRATVGEKEVRHLRAQAVGVAIPTADAALRLPVTLQVVPAVPTGADKFEVRLNVEPGEGADFLLPGMTCVVRVLAYENKLALAVPSSAVFDEGAKSVVYLKTGKGHQAVAVTLGRSSGGKTEILSGVKAGDEIHLEKPTE